MTWPYGPTLFLHVPRTGGSSIQEALIAAAIPYRHLEGIASRNLAHADPPLLPLDRYWTFSVVRHPFDRLVSLAGYILRPPTVTHDPEQLPIEVFEAFVRRGYTRADGTPYLLHEGTPREFDITTPQARCLDVPTDRLFRFEQLADFPLPLGGYNFSGHHPWWAYYRTPEIRAQVTVDYADDFARFSYLAEVP